MKSIVLIDVEKKPDTITDHYYVISRTEPLGLLYLESFLEAHGVPVYVYKIPLTARDWKNIRKADIIGLSGLTYAWSEMRDLAAKIRRENSKAIIVAGREHASLSYETVLKDSNFDAVVIGEGEKSLLDLAEGKDFKDINSLVYRDDSGRLVINSSHLPISCEDIFPLKRRPEWMNNMLHETSYLFPKMAGITLSRGCAFKCEFCTAEKMWGRYRNFGISHALDEIQRVIDKHNIRYFAFHDLMLNTNPRVLTQFCQEILKRKIEANFFSMMSVTASLPNFTLLRKAGFNEIGVGIEVPSDRRVDIGKNLSFQRAINFVRAIFEAGIFVRGYFILGWPWEKLKKELIENYLAALEILPINALRISFLTPFPGTLTYMKYKDYCIYQPPESGFDHFTTMEPILKFKLPPNQLVEARAQILKKYYSSKAYFEIYKNQSKSKILNQMNEIIYERVNENNEQILY